QSGHVLMVKRKHSPGKNLWALPGGFLDVKETLFKSALRELYEETNIKLSELTLINSMKYEKVFDAPGRSLRGRTVTHAFLFYLQPTEELPKVKAADDAAEAKWIPYSDLLKMGEEIFEDHLSIVKY